MHFFNDYILDDIDLKKKKIISCDIFDTLVFRKVVEPTDVFQKVGEIALNKKLIPDHLDSIEFKELRIDAQSRARQKKFELEGHWEVTLREIYTQFPSNLFLIDELYELEIKVETSLIYLNKKVYSFLNKLKKKGYKIILLSDMYLNTEQIKYILLNSGADLSVFDEVIVSSEYRASKYDSQLYNIMLNKYKNVNKNKFVHIGDNFVSDYINAKKMGIESYHYALDHLREEKYKLEMVKKEHCMEQIFSLRKKLSFNNKYKHEEDCFWYDFGATVLGPVFTSYIEEVVKVGHQKNIRYIYPLMRDGYIFQKMLEVYNELEQESFVIKPLYVSRLSTYLGSLSEFNSDVLEDLLNNSQLTIESLFNRFKITKHPFTMYNQKTLSSVKSIFCSDGVSIYDKVLNYFLSPNILKKVNDIITHQRELLVKYIEQTVNLNDKAMMIDVGYSGTINNALENSFQIENKKSNIVHILLISGLNLNEKLLDSIYIGSFIKYQNHKEFFKSGSFISLLFDTLMQKNIGSVNGYNENQDGKVVPVLDDVFIEQKNNRRREICQEGILDFYRHFLQFKRENMNTKSAYLSSDKAMWLIERYMKYPTKTEAKYLGELYTENDFNFKSRVKLCTEEEEEKARILGAERYLMKKQKRINVWQAGVIERVYPYYSSLRLYKQSANNSTQAMAQTVEYLINNSIKTCIVYGAGEMGRSLVRMLNMCAIQVLCLVDRNDKLWGDFIEGIEVVSFEQSKSLSSNVYVIASLAFVDEIHDFIKSNYGDKEVIIIDYLGDYKYKNKDTLN